MRLGRLSEREEDAVLKIRADEAKQIAADKFQRKAIATAHKFTVWSNKHGDGLTFSTFVNQFNYDAPDYKAMYEAVKRIQDAAWPLD